MTEMTRSRKEDARGDGGDGDGHARAGKRHRVHEEDAAAPSLATAEAYALAAAAHAASTAITSEEIQCRVSKELAVYQTTDPVVTDAVYKYHLDHCTADVDSSPTASLLEACIAHGDLDTLRLLVSHDVQITEALRGQDGKLPIHLACQHGQLEVVKYMVANESLLYGVYDPLGGPSPLATACRYGQLEVVKWLVENGGAAVANVQGAHLPLIEAVLCGDLRIVEYLITQGMSATSKESPMQSAWLVAVKHGRLRILKCFVDNRLADLANDYYLRLCIFESATQTENVGMLRYFLGLGVFRRAEVNECLGIAAKLQNVEIINLFVSSGGAGVNAVNTYGDTPLVCAMQDSYMVDATQALLELGADVSRPAGVSEYAAIHMMTISGRLDLLKMVQQMSGSAASFKAPSRRERCTPLHLAATFGHIDIVNFLLDALASDVDLDIENRYDETPLTLAAREEHLDVVRLLVANGATINFQNNGGGQSALFCAAEAGRFDIVQFLCANGADVLWRRYDGVSALCAAARKGNTDIVEYLAEMGGADLNAVTFDLTALNEAVIHGHTDVARVLIAHNAHARDNQEQRSNLLCQAIVFNSADIAVLLVNNGADVNAPYTLTIDDEDLTLTPLLVAAGCGNLHLVRYLCEKGADVEGVSNQNETALFFAAAWGNLDVVEYLASKQNANVLSTTSYGFTPSTVSACSHRHVYDYLYRYVLRRPKRFILDEELLNDELQQASAAGAPLRAEHAVDAAYWRRKNAADGLITGEFLL